MAINDITKGVFNKENFDGEHFMCKEIVPWSNDKEILETDW